MLVHLLSNNSGLYHRICAGLLLEQGEAAKALEAWGSVAFGVASILFLTPLAAPLLLRLPLQPPELALGLAIFSLTPTTLSSGVALMQVHCTVLFHSRSLTDEHPAVDNVNQNLTRFVCFPCLMSVVP